jgi:SAM-dependent methyltransferase
MFTRLPAGYDNGFPYFYDTDRRAVSDFGWWDELDDATLHDFKERHRAGQRYKVDHFLVPTIRQFGFFHARILSVGCGMGFDVQRLKELGYKAIGTDFGGRTKAWTELGLTGDDLFLADARDLPIGDAEFDVVFMWHVIEHIGCQDGNQQVTPGTESDRRRSIERIRAALRPGGILVIGTPNRLFPLDQYHGAHTYLPGGLQKWAIKRRVGLHLPFSKRNFLVSKAQLARLLYGFQELRWLSAGCGISFGRSDFAEYLPEGHLGPALAGYVHLIDRLRLSTSPLSPVLHVAARK